LLYFLPFIVLMLVLLHGWFGGRSTPCVTDGIISLPFAEWYDTVGGIQFIGLVGLLLVAYILFFITERYKLLLYSTVLPTLFYAFLTIGIYCHYGLNNYLAASFCLALGVWRLQEAIFYTRRNAPVFDFGFFVGATVLLCPDLVLLVAWALLVIPFSGRVSVRDWVAVLMGLCTPVLFAGGYYFWVDRLNELPERFVDLVLAGDFFWNLVKLYPIPFGVFILLILFSLGNVLICYPMTVIAQRRGMIAMFSLLLFLGSSLFLFPFSCHGVMYVLAIPLAYLFSQYFITQRTRWLGSSLFLLLLAACVLFVFY